MQRYVIATLYDNDFTGHLQAGVAYIASRAEHDLTEEEFKDFLVDFIVYYSAIRVINKRFKQTTEQLEYIRRYVSKELKVTLTDTKPEYSDKNWECVMHDRMLDYTWAV